MRPIAIISDTQQTSWFEQLILRRESNLDERDALFKNLAQENPSLLLHLGDVCFSPNAKNISCFAKAALPLQLLNARKFLLPGNHDYPLISSKHYQPNFPYFESIKTCSLLIEQTTALVFLNSNKRHLTNKMWKTQQKWFESTLQSLESNAEITQIIVFTHHPPFTNSKVTGDERHVQKAFLKPFMTSTKTCALISGHVHAYERFIKEKKTFIVTGGGGGPRVDLHSSRHQDSFIGRAPRPFHYLLIRLGEKTLNIEVKGLNKGEGVAQTIELVNL